MRVYLDEVWLLNTLLDYLLLVATADMCGLRIYRRKFLLLATIGGAYASAGFLWPILQKGIFALPVGIVLGWSAFGRGRIGRKAIAIFCLLSAALAGTITALMTMAGSISWPILLFSSGVFYLLMEIVFRQTARFGRNEIERVSISLAGREATVQALYDTGHTLRSPINGAPVLVAEIDPLRALWSDEEEMVLLSQLPPQEKVARLYALGYDRFSLLPYTAVGGSGLLLCMRSDAVTVGKQRYRRTPVALVGHTLGSNYNALWGGEQEYEVATVHTCQDRAQAG